MYNHALNFFFLPEPMLANIQLLFFQENNWSAYLKTISLNTYTCIKWKIKKVFLLYYDFMIITNVHIQIFHFGRYIVGYRGGNLVLRRRARNRKT